jgi:hypothetical protein
VLVQGAPVPHACQVIASRQLVLQLAGEALLGQLLAKLPHSTGQDLVHRFD